MTSIPQTKTFGKRREPHTVIIAHGDDIRHFTVRPWLAALLGSALAAIAMGYLLATTYLVLRDDLIGATATHQARLQQAYEDRISALRTQLDRVTSRQLLDQQLMESKVSKLLDRQALLTRRHGRIGPILDRARLEKGLPVSAPLPSDRPDIRAGLSTRASGETGDSAAIASPAQATLAAFVSPGKPAFSSWPVRDVPGKEPSVADRTDRMFAAMNKSLGEIEKEQLVRIDSIAQNAYQTADAISDALESAGLKVDLGDNAKDMGGPLIEVDDSIRFEERVRELDEALDRLDAIKTVAAKMPIFNPATNHGISSRFGIRRDPILGKQAFHSGLDLRATMGTPVHASGGGTIVKAGWNGGYGRMVEIDHGDGIITRYGHMSKILVKAGETVAKGDVIGKVGSSGRSTGPHLHFEVRRDGAAVNPVPYLVAGKKVSQYL